MGRQKPRPSHADYFQASYSEEFRRFLGSDIRLYRIDVLFIRRNLHWAVEVGDGRPPSQRGSRRPSAGEMEATGPLWSMHVKTAQKSMLWMVFSTTFSGPANK